MKVGQIWKNFYQCFCELNVNMTFLYVTETEYSKGNININEPLKRILIKNKLYNCGIQYESVFELPTKMIFHDYASELKTSLHSPKTKKEDLKICFECIENYFDANDFIALFAHKKYLYLLNLTDENVKKSLLSKEYVYQKLLKVSQEKQSTALELYDELKKVHNKGFIPSVVSWDEGVSRTLEYELDIVPDSSENPNYNGIELKSSRKIIKNKTDNILLNNVADWKNSPCKSTKELIEKYGSQENDRIQLCSTVSALKANSQGLYLDIDNNESKLNVMHIDEGEVVECDLEYLKQSLLKKHPETFLVEAQSKFIDNVEYFHYNRIIHLMQPAVELITTLIMNDIITLDLEMHIKADGYSYLKSSALKINEDDLNKLFPEPKEYDLNF